VQVHTKRSSAGRGAEQEGWAVLRHQPRGVPTFASPNRRDGKQIRQVQGMEQDTAHVTISVARKTAAPSLDGVDGFEPAGKPEILNSLDYGPNVLRKSFQVFVEADDVARVLSELHVARGRHSHCLFGVFGHHLGVEIHCAILTTQDLILEAADA
jgi:hypothetical protein